MTTFTRKIKITNSCYYLLCLAYYLLLTACSSNGQNTDDYFDCKYYNKYNYFKDTAYPTVSKEDTIAFDEWVKKLTLKDTDSSLKGFLKGISVGNIYIFRKYKAIDTLWSEKLLLNRYKQTIKFKSLEWSDLIDFTSASAAVIGTVLDTKYEYERDSLCCHWFKVNYVIKVEEVINSYFPLKEGDLLLAKDMMGADGNHTSTYIADYHQEYKKGERNIFLLDREWYRMRFLCLPKVNKEAGHTQYHDKYCPNAFTIQTSSNDYSLKNDSIKLADMRLFFNTKFKER